LVDPPGRGASRPPRRSDRPGSSEGPSARSSDTNEAQVGRRRPPVAARKRDRPAPDQLNPPPTGSRGHGKLERKSARFDLTLDKRSSVHEHLESLTPNIERVQTEGERGGRATRKHGIRV